MIPQCINIHLCPEGIIFVSHNHIISVTGFGMSLAIKPGKVIDSRLHTRSAGVGGTLYDVRLYLLFASRIPRVTTFEPGYIRGRLERR
jgi:hypothetical protein